MFNPDSDLVAIQNILIDDPVILELMRLAGKSRLEKAKSIIRKSQYSDMAGSASRLCIYFRPSRSTRNDSFLEEVIQIDCHVPSDLSFQSYQVQERIKLLLHKKRINKRYLYFYGQLGELPTASGFFCTGSRYRFYRNI